MSKYQQRLITGNGTTVLDYDPASSSFSIEYIEEDVTLARKDGLDKDELTAAARKMDDKYMGPKRGRDTIDWYADWYAHDIESKLKEE